MLPNNLGDVIMALPVLEALKKKVPDSTLSFMVEEGYEGGLVENRFCDKVIVFSRKLIKQQSITPAWKNGIELLERTIAEVSYHGADSLVNLSQHPYLSIVATLSQAARGVGRFFLPEGNPALLDWWSQYLYAIPFARRYNNMHVTDIYKRIAGADITSVLSNPIFISAVEEESSRIYLLTHGWDGVKRVIVFQPGAAYPAKRWSREAFVALGKRLGADGYFIVITGAGAEVGLARGIADELEGYSTVTAGELSFRETIALLTQVMACVTGDTAIMHAAAGLKKKVFALFGPTNPVETGPYGSGHVVFAGSCAQRPCFCTTCKSMLCMKSIDPADVYAAIVGHVIVRSHCDVLVTAMAKGAYQLEPIVPGAHPYYNSAGAGFTRGCFEKDTVTDAMQLGGADRESLVVFVNQCAQLEQTLCAYQVDKNPELLRYFEKLRCEIDTVNGIVAFWYALLNIRLNSVPLLDPAAAVIRYQEACKETRLQLEWGLSHGL